MAGQQIDCPTCSQKTQLVGLAHKSTQRISMPDFKSGVKSKPPSKQFGCGGCLLVIFILGVCGGLAGIVINALVENTWVTRDTEIRDARVLQIEERRKEVIEQDRADLGKISTNTIPADLPIPKEIYDEMLSSVAKWDHETPKQRHQDAVNEEWAEYQKDKAAIEDTERAINKFDSDNKREYNWQHYGDH
jgi:hypothetical protein